MANKKNKNTNSVPVFKSEIEAGLAQQIQSTASIAYVAQLEDIRLSQEVARDFFKSAATEDNSIVDTDQFDLFYLNTILVTTGCNQNLDVFTKEPTWAARYSPIHKQFNLEHDQSKIIGHMTTAKAVNDKFELIDDDISPADLPDKFHILTGAVIYRALSDEQAQADIEKIIEEIAVGDWYVSMECLFRGFDYAAIAEDGTQKIIARDEDSAWLTKHLRQYGGSGSYNGYTLGRVLKDITFSGKGLVRKPANPDSIIFSSKNMTAFASSGYIMSSDVDKDNQSVNNINSNSNNDKIVGSVNMANATNEVDPKVKELEGKVAELTEANKKLADTVKASESSATTAKISALEADIVSKNTKVSELETEVKTLSDAKVNLDTKLKDAVARAEKAEKSVADAKALEATRARVEKLTKLDAPEDEAKNLVALFTDKTDEQFDALATLVAPKWKKVEAVVQVVNASAATVVTTVTEPVVNQKALDDAEPVADAALASTGTNKEVEATREKMSSVFASILKSGKGKKAKFSEEELDRGRDSDDDDDEE